MQKAFHLHFLSNVGFLTAVEPGRQSLYAAGPSAREYTELPLLPE